MLFLVMDIPHYSKKILFTKRQYTIFILPVELKIRLNDMIDVMRSIPFDVTNEFCRRNLWRYGNRKMHMLFNPANCVNKASHIFGFCRNGTIKLRLKDSIN